MQNNPPQPNSSAEGTVASVNGGLGESSFFDLLDNAIPDIFAFLTSVNQHKLRCTSSILCEKFDSAAESGSLALCLSVEPAIGSPSCRWKHSPLGLGGNCVSKQKGAVIPKSTESSIRATVTLHVYNFFLSTLNKSSSRSLALLRGVSSIERVGIEPIPDVPFAHKLVIKGLLGIKSIGDNFCSGAKATEIEFRADSNELRTIGNDWMSKCQNLKSVTFAGFAPLEEVGGSWMSLCPNLESITFNGEYLKLRKVGNSWLQSCKKLTSVDLSALTQLAEVGKSWMSRCLSLESITFANEYLNLKKVGDDWMNECAKLKTVDLRGFIALEEVGSNWLSGCHSLESIAFAPEYPKLRKIGERWISHCRRLKSLDLTGFAALEEVGMNSVYNCPDLENVTFASEYPKLKVAKGWMTECPKLQNVDLTKLFALEKTSRPPPKNGGRLYEWGTNPQELPQDLNYVEQSDTPCCAIM